MMTKPNLFGLMCFDLSFLACYKSSHLGGRLMTNEEKILAKLDALSLEIKEAKSAIMPYVELKKEMGPIFDDFLQEVIGKLGGIDRKFSVEDVGDLIGQLLVSSKNMAEVLKTLNSMIELKQDITPYTREMFQSSVAFLHGTTHGLNGEDAQDLIKQSVANMGNIAESLKILNSVLEFKKDIGSLSELVFNDVVEKLEVLKKKGLFSSLEGLIATLERVGTKMNEIDLNKTKPIRGVFGMLSALRRPEVQEGLGVLIELSTVMTAIKQEPAV
jgi:uncharacterized protein YjgD (DUF1641 family)